MDKNLKKKSRRDSFKQTISVIFWTLRISFKYAPVHTTITFVVNVITSLSPIITSLLLARLIDIAIKAFNSNITQSQILGLIYQPLLLLVLFDIATTMLGKLTSYSQRKIDFLIQWNLKIDLHEKLQTLGIQTLEEPSINNEIQRAKENLNRVVGALELTSSLISYTVTLIGAAVTLALKLPIVIILYLIFLIPKYFSDKYFLGKLWKIDRESTEERRVALDMIDTLTSTKQLQELNITNGTSYLSKKYHSFVENFIKVRMDVRRKWFSLSFLLESGSGIVAYFGYYLSITKLIAREITVGNLTFYFRMINLFEDSFLRVSGLFTNIYELTVRLAEIKNLFELTPKSEIGKIVIEKSAKGPKIDIKDLSFKYPDSEKYVIESLNLNIKSGEKIAIVGHNGAGKTTLIKLLSHFYEPTGGQIFINDIDLNKITQNSWFKNLGVLFQDYNTYEYLTAKENVVLGNPDINFDKKRFEEALASADADDFIKEYKDSFDQILSEKYKGGIRPSTGQWQKIAISRFFYRNAPLVIFDEPTAAIDSVSEYKIFNKIYDFFNDKTVIIISHRFSTVRNADRIIVMDKGKIIEQGNHIELLKKDGVYAHSFKLQAEGYK